MKKMAVGNYNGHFSNQQVHTNSGIYEENPISKSYSCEYIFCEEKQNLGLFTYHLEGLCVPLVVRIPQVGNHCTRWKYFCSSFYWKLG